MNEDFIAKYKCDANTNKRAQVKLLEACEKVKKTMSANSIDIPLNLECFMNDKVAVGLFQPLPGVSLMKPSRS